MALHSVTEKRSAHDFGQVQTSSPGPKEDSRLQSADVDQAYHFLANDAASQGPTEEVDTRHLRRRIDWRILPIMFLCYTVGFIDKVALNVSIVTSPASPAQYMLTKLHSMQQ